MAPLVFAIFVDQLESRLRNLFEDRKTPEISVNQSTNEQNRGQSVPLYNIARNQRALMFCLICQLLFGIIGAVSFQAKLQGLPTLGNCGMFIAWFFGIVCGHELAKNLRLPIAVIVVLLFVPYVSALTIFVLIGLATAALKAGGVKVGLTGVSSADLMRLKS